MLDVLTRRKAFHYLCCFVLNGYGVMGDMEGLEEIGLTRFFFFFLIKIRQDLNPSEISLFFIEKNQYLC